MPKSIHQGLVEAFRARPSLAAELLTHALGLAIPAYETAELTATEVTDFGPMSYAADVVVRLAMGRTTVLVVVIEVQLNRDKDKPWSWPIYLSSLRGRMRCPAMLLVMCVNDRIAAWCARPIPMGQPGWELRPLVLGPDRIPIVADAEQARQLPELTVLSAIAYSRGTDRDKVLQSFCTALDTTTPHYLRGAATDGQHGPGRPPNLAGAGRDGRLSDRRVRRARRAGRLRARHALPLRAP